jgi:hypothetical protein
MAKACSSCLECPIPLFRTVLIEINWLAIQIHLHDKFPEAGGLSAGLILIGRGVIHWLKIRLMSLVVWPRFDGHEISWCNAKLRTDH